MADSTKAVFLSYASQDTEAARRICEALRAAGLEVWFDQSELVGGDAWDAKIRKHIKECALLIPVISAATQARTEGYFRLEWRLADQRTHLMAKGRPFLLPVVIDDTRDADAHVPDSFTEVQWTRLPGGETTPAFTARVQKLLSGEVKAGRGPLTPPAAPMAESGGRARQPKPKPVWLWVLLALVVAVPAYFIFKPRRSAEEIGRIISPAQPMADNATKPAASAVPASEARKLVTQARALIDDDPLAVRENYLTAKRLGERAIELDPGDPEAYAVTARAACALIMNYRDSSPASFAAARARAESAIRLGPDSVEAALALAHVDLLVGTRLAEVEQRLEKLLSLAPADRRVLHLLQLVAMRQSKPDNAQKWIDRALALPGGDPESLNNRAEILWGANAYPQMAATLEQSLAQRTTALACHFKLMLLVWGWGDLPAGRAWVEQMPASLLQEDRVAMLAYLTWYWSRQPDRALDVLQRFPRPFIEQGSLFVSTDYLTGCAQLLAGHPEAAQLAFTAGLKAINDRLAAEPGNPRYVYEKIRLLARLGQHADAEKNFRLLQELGGSNDVQLLRAELVLLAGAPGDVLAACERGIDRGRSRWPIRVNELRYDPVFDPLRTDPRFQAIVAKGEAQLAELRAAGAPGGANPAPARPPEADEKSVAVLAFANLSDDKANEYFSDGISEELLTVLQKIPGLHVAARTSSFYFKGKEATAQEIGAKLGVANLVEGSVQKSGSRVKVTARLSRVATGEELWSESYTREVKDVFALQEELALAIVGELRGQLAGGDNAAAVKAAVKGGTTNAEAYQQYLQARYYANRHAEKPTNEAIGYFQRAVDLDPAFALAWAGLADTHLWLCEFSTVLDRQGFELHLGLARTAVDRALELEPKLPEGLLARAHIQLNVDYDWKSAEANLRMAQALAPADPAIATASGNLASALGDDALAIARFRESVALDPVNPVARSYLAYAYVTTGQFAEAQAEYARLVELNPTAPWAYAGLGLAYVREGKFDQAIETGQNDAAEWARLLIVALARFGQKRLPEADAALALLTAKFADTAAYQIAEVHAYRGDRDQAFEWLERARRQRDGGITGLQTDPLLANLKTDPRFATFLRKLGLVPVESK